MTPKCMFCNERGPSLNTRVEFKRGTRESYRVTEVPMTTCPGCAAEFARVFSIEGGQRPVLMEALVAALHLARDNRPTLEMPR